MNPYELWEKSLESTCIVRTRIAPLSLYKKTSLYYHFFAPSLVNEGSTILRRGVVLVERPDLFLLSHSSPHIEGFDDCVFDKLTYDFLLVRGIKFQPLKYSNTAKSFELFDEPCDKLVEKFLKKMQKEEDTRTALIVGSEDCWQYSILIFVSRVLSRSCEKDVYKILSDHFESEGDQI